MKLEPLQLKQNKLTIITDNLPVAYECEVETTVECLIYKNNSLKQPFPFYITIFTWDIKVTNISGDPIILYSLSDAFGDWENNTPNKVDIVNTCLFSRQRVKERLQNRCNDQSIKIREITINQDEIASIINEAVANYEN